MQLNIAKPARWQFQLCRVQEEARNAEPDLTVQRIVRAAGQDAAPRANLRRGTCDNDPIRMHLDARYTRAPFDIDSSRRSTLQEILIEDAPIDYDGFHAIAAVGDFVPGWREKASRCQLIQERSAWEREFVEGVGRQHAGAMDGFADVGMFFEKGGVEAGSGKAGGGEEARWASADDDHVMHRGHSTPAFARLLRASLQIRNRRRGG
jgi:hypothetical protein